MTTQQILQWVTDHWPQISATVGAILYLITTVAVGLKEQPLPGEGKLNFWWRVAGRVAFATFKNIYGTWKVPGAKQPGEFVLATTPEAPTPKLISDEVTDRHWPTPPKKPLDGATDNDKAGEVPSMPESIKQAPRSQAGTILG